MVSGRYILIAPAMGKLQNFLLIILCGNDRNSGFYDKSNAFIFFFILTKNLLRRRILFLVFLFCSCKVFFLHVLAACRRALKIFERSNKFVVENDILLHQSNTETTANQRAHFVVPMKAYEIKHL